MPNFWLFKSEPEEYSIDDLENAEDQRVCWDGIRNYQARNFIRDKVAKGDLLFFYHSSCRETGIAGVCQVVSSPYPDPTQFDPLADNFDARSTVDHPRWFSVDIALKDKFKEVLRTTALRKQQALEDMVLFKNPRLSIQPVKLREWQLIYQ